MGTRLNTNSIVLRFGERFKKEDIIGVVKPIERTIGVKNTLYIIHYTLYIIHYTSYTNSKDVFGKERQETCFWSRVGV